MYIEKIGFLSKIINIFTNLNTGNGNFKLVQRGIIISTKSIMDLTHLILHGV